MSEENTVFNVSRGGKVIYEGLSLTQMAQGLSIKVILTTDHYWTNGMSDWAPISSRQWVAPPAPKPSDKPKSPEPAETPKPATPVVPPNQSAPNPVVGPVEKGFSPYVIYYRSDDDRWAFGIFGGLAHRNGWPKPFLLITRLLTLITFFPALAYIFGVGLTAFMLTPSLPTANVRSYYDLNNGKPSRDVKDFSRLIKIILVGILVLIVMIAVVPMIVKYFR